MCCSIILINHYGINLALFCYFVVCCKKSTGTEHIIVQNSSFMDNNVQFNLLKTVTIQLCLSLLEMKNETKAISDLNIFTYIFIKSVNYLGNFDYKKNQTKTDKKYRQFRQNETFPRNKNMPSLVLL